MPAGYRFLPQPNDVAQAVLAESTWAVLGADLRHRAVHAGALPREHRARQSRPSTLWKDVFLFHWKEESQHAILDELEWLRENAKLDAAQRDAAVDDLIALVGAVDGICCMQAAADAEYFCRWPAAPSTARRREAIGDTLLAAYRWQYIVSGVQDPRFLEIIGSMIDARQGERINAALAPIVGAVH